MVNDPAGTTTISGQSAHSLKESPGLSMHSSETSSEPNGCDRDDSDAVVGADWLQRLSGVAGLETGAGAAFCARGGVADDTRGATTATLVLSASICALASPANAHAGNRTR